MVVNFRARGISRGARKLARTPTLIKKKESCLGNLEGCSSTGQALSLFP
jgi:hypothetical protein